MLMIIVYMYFHLPSKKKMKLVSVCVCQRVFFVLLMTALFLGWCVKKTSTSNNNIYNGINTLFYAAQIYHMNSIHRSMYGRPHNGVYCSVCHTTHTHTWHVRNVCLHTLMCVYCTHKQNVSIYLAGRSIAQNNKN